MRIKKCPNKECEYHLGAVKKFYCKKGYFITRWNSQPVPRYQCRYCWKYFSSHTFRNHYKQTKPYLNQQIYQLYCSAVTQRRIARILGVDCKTVTRKFLFMACLAKEEHERRVALGQIKTAKIQFDEMETFEHTRLKPLSIALAVREKTGEIVAARVATMNCKGHLAEISRQKYGFRVDTRQVATIEALHIVNQCKRENLKILTDFKKEYRALIKSCVPSASHEQHSRKCAEPGLRTCDRRNKDDKLFTLNYTAAKIRHDLSRMGRRVWITTKKTERLQAHLDLYIAYNNQYQLAA